MSDAPDVDQLLRDLERELDRQGSPFSSVAAPPIDPRRLDEAEKRVGHGFPAELRAWWLWHDGSAEQPGRASAHKIGSGAWWPYPLEQALRERAWWSAERNWGDDPFPATWLPFAGTQSKRLNAKLELSTSDRLVMGVVALPGELEEFGATAPMTFPELIQGWIDFLREGHAIWDVEEDCWIYRMPPPAEYHPYLFWG